jgi:hypothetical protein
MQTYLKVSCRGTVAGDITLFSACPSCLQLHRNGTGCLSEDQDDHHCLQKRGYHMKTLIPDWRFGVAAFGVALNTITNNEVAQFQYQAQPNYQGPGSQCLQHANVQPPANTDFDGIDSLWFILDQ